MKKLILIALVAVSTASFGACDFTLDVKKDGAKTAYASGGVSVSKKIQDALTAQGCTVKYNVMSKAEIKAMTIESLQRRLKKLESQK